jgi:hypothetical protein
MKERNFEIIHLDEHGECKTVAWFQNNESTKFNLVTFVMTDLLHIGSIWDKRLREMIEQRFKFYENDRNTFVEFKPDNYYFCWAR